MSNKKSTQHSSNTEAVVMRNINFVSADKVILHTMSMQIANHQKVLLLGPNASGKSTLIKIIAGVLRATMGQCSVFDMLPYTLPAKKHCAYVPQHIEFPVKLTVAEVINFVASHYQQPLHLNRLLQSYELHGDAYASTLSGGQKHRLMLALALLSQPTLLLLDEPENGLDVQFRERVLHEIFRSFRERHVAVVMATHLFATKIHYFDRVIILKRGTIIFDGSVDQFLEVGKRVTLPTHSAEAIYLHLLGEC